MPWKWCSSFQKKLLNIQNPISWIWNIIYLPSDPTLSDDPGRKAQKQEGGGEPGGQAQQQGRGGRGQNLAYRSYWMGKKRELQLLICSSSRLWIKPITSFPLSQTSTTVMASFSNRIPEQTKHINLNGKADQTGATQCEKLPSITSWRQTWADIGDIKGSWDEIAEEYNTSAEQVEEKPVNIKEFKAVHVFEEVSHLMLTRQ